MYFVIDLLVRKFLVECLCAMGVGKSRLTDRTGGAQFHLVEGTRTEVRWELGKLRICEFANLTSEGN